MSCWHLTVALRIPASALGFKYLREWKEFLQKHEDDFCWEEGCFCESMCDDYPGGLGWGTLEFTDPEWHLDYYLRDDYPLLPEYNSYGANDEIRILDEDEKEKYLPEYQALFPQFTLKDMDAVRRCSFEWYDGSGASYFYSCWDDD